MGRRHHYPNAIQQDNEKEKNNAIKRQVKVFYFFSFFASEKNVLLHKRKPVISKAIITKDFFLPVMEAGSLITWPARETGY